MISVSSLSTDLLKIAVDLSTKNSFTRYLTGYMPLLDKMSEEEFEDIVNNALTLVDLEKDILAISEAPKLVEKIKSLQKDLKLPPNKEIEKLIKMWENKKLDDNGLLSKTRQEVKNDIGLDVSKEYIKKLLWNIKEIRETKQNPRKELMRYFTNIILKGSGHGLASIDDMQKISSDEKLIMEIIASSVKQYTVMGTTPGDGGVVSASNPKDAWIKFVVLYMDATEQEARNDLKKSGHQIEPVKDKNNKIIPGHWTIGGYEIKEVIKS